MEKFMEMFMVWAPLLVLVVEFVIAKSPLKENSTIELVVNGVLKILKFILKVEDKPEENYKKQ